MLAETHALLLGREGRQVALDGLHGIDQGTAVIVRAEAVDEEAARALLGRYRDKGLTLTDATSFVVMERLGIAHAVTFDRLFARYGFRLLEPTGPSG